MSKKLSQLGKISGRFESRGYNAGDHFGLHGRQLKFVGPRGKVLFLIMARDLFDESCQRFEDDLS